MAYPWSAHDILTAADLNAAFAATGPGAWTSWTPTWTQSATITKTVSNAGYQKDQRNVTAEFYLIATGAGTANNPLIISLPVTAAFGAGAAGSGYFFDASASTFYTVIFDKVSTTTAKMIYSGTAYLGQTGGGFAAAIAASDVLTGVLNYQSAS